MPETITTPAKQKISKTASKASSPPKEADVVPTTKTTRATRKTRKVFPSTAMITSSEERHRLIAEAAYYLAEKRGFQNGNPDQDWLEAVTQIDSMFMS